MSKFLSVIVCTFNRRQFLDLCITELVRQMDDHGDSTELIVVDNNSTDSTAELVRNYGSRHAWIKYAHEPNQGLSHARNCGATLAEGRYLCYLDDDAKPSADYLNNVHKMLREQTPDIAGGPVYPYYTTSKPRWFRDEFEIRNHSPESGFNTTCSISGGNFIIRRNLLFELGGFSPEFGMVGTKTRLGDEKALLLEYRSKMNLEAQRVFYSQDCSVLHHVPPHKMSLRYFLKRGFFSGRALVVLKNQSWFAARKSLKSLFRGLLFELPRSMMVTTNASDHPAMIIQRIGIDIGKLTMVAQRSLSRKSGRPRSER